MNVCFILPYCFSLIYYISLLLPIFSYFSLIPCPLFFPHCPLSFSFLTCQTAYLFLFSFPIWLSLLSFFSLSFFCASSTLFHSYFLSLYHPHFLFFLICLPISFPLYSYIHILWLVISFYSDACFSHPHGYLCTHFWVCCFWVRRMWCLLCQILLTAELLGYCFLYCLGAQHLFLKLSVKLLSKAIFNRKP